MTFSNMIRWLGAFLSMLIMFIGSSGTTNAQACRINCVPPPSPPDRPYFKAYGGDVFAGGWVTDNNTCNMNNYQAPDYVSATGQYKGSILSFSRYDGTNGQGSSSEYGALALGVIEGKPAGNTTDIYGFFSNAIGSKTGGSGSSNNKLSFANPITPSLSVGNYWAGFFEGSRQAHCIPDYFGTKQYNPTVNTTVNIISDIPPQDGHYLYTPPGGTLIITQPSGSSIGQGGQGKKVTIFVNGNVYINSDIKYDNRLNYTVDNPPKFALVAKGSIYISENVSNLEGLYIAQPNMAASNPVTDDTGVIWTCHGPAAASAYSSADLYNRCRKQLKIKGAFIAKQVNLLRSNGDVKTQATTNEGENSATIAEVVKYEIEMVTGGPFFNLPRTPGQTESLISLPPVF